MRTMLAVMLVSSLAFADPPADSVAADAPTVDYDAPGRSLTVEPGTIVPFAGVCLDSQEAISRERSRVRALNELDAAREYVWVSTPVLIGVLVGVLAVGAVAGAGVAIAVKR
jgi:hypothetical protein